MELSPGPLTQDQIIWWFKKFKYDPEFRWPGGAHSVPLQPLCDWLGISKRHLRDILDHRCKLTESYRPRFELAIRMVAEGLRFARVNRKWQPVGKHAGMTQIRYVEDEQSTGDRAAHA